MLYIYQTSCISPQPYLLPLDGMQTVKAAVNNCMTVTEPDYPAIPQNILRRMGKAVRIGVGAAAPIIDAEKNIAGIVIGTANGGMEDCIKFLNQIIDYDEGVLTPTNFVQSTPNAVAAQLGLLSGNKNYNATHVHRGLAFENALQDVMMLSAEQPKDQFLLGALDEISTYNYVIESLGGWYKQEIISNEELYNTATEGSIAGEGTSMFLVGGNKTNAIAKIYGVDIIHAESESEILDRLHIFLNKMNISVEDLDTLVTGENGDVRLQHFYSKIESEIPKANIIRYKHLTGEYPTASAFSVWLATQLSNTRALPLHFYKRKLNTQIPKNILIYNNYKGLQHSFIYVTFQ